MPEEVVDQKAYLDAAAEHLIVEIGHPYDLGPLEEVLTARDG